VLPTDPKCRGRMGGQCGVALLSIMFILVLLTTMAVYVTEADYLLLKRVGNQRDFEQGMQLALGSEQWAARILQRDLANSGTDHLDEDWNKLGSPVSVDDGKLRTVVRDMQSRFNLNNLTRRDEVWYPAFRRLLRLLEIDEGLAEAVVDWIDADQQRTHADGAEDLEYLLFDPPYRAANRPMIDLGEMLLVNGVTEEILNKLAPFVTVIPDPRETRINVNTCPPLLLQVIGGEISSSDAESLANARGETGFESITEFLQRPELAGEANLVAEPMISLSTDYFVVTSEVQVNNVNLATHSVIRRNAANGAVAGISRAWGFL
jgi:general secretion pathway protein K